MEIALDKVAMDYLVGLGKKTRDVEVVEIDGHTYVDSRELTRIDPIDPIAPDIFDAYSLAGLVDYLKADVDGMFDKYRRYIVSVTSPTEVHVYAPLSGHRNARACVARCVAQIPKIPFDRYMDTESFVITVMTCFKECKNRDLVIKIVGNMREEQSSQVTDDGITQKVTIKSGVAKVEDVAVKNPVYLAPIRTFHEVTQPISPFLLRIKEGPQAALYEADGGAWKYDAVMCVKNWLAKNLEGLAVEVIA